MSDFIVATPHRTRLLVGFAIVLPMGLLITYVPLRGAGLDVWYWTLCLAAGVGGTLVGYLRKLPDRDPVDERAVAIAVAVAVPVWASMTLAAGIGEFGLVAGPVIVFVDLVLITMSARALREAH